VGGREGGRERLRKERENGGATWKKKLRVKKTLPLPPSLPPPHFAKSKGKWTDPSEDTRKCVNQRPS